MKNKHIVIVSPALANANNGNWQTARRWARFLASGYRVTLAEQWDGASCDALIALHARRSAASIAAFANASPCKPLIVVLTGTDLYRDIRTDTSAQRSLQLATQLVVLQPAGLQELDLNLRGKTQVIYQSAPTLKAISLERKHNARYFDVVMVGHLRDEKDPATFMRAASQINSPQVRLIHIGRALDPSLGAQAEATQAAHQHYRWLDDMPHAATRQRLKRSQLMVITSKMEGGANVIIKAVSSGVPVLASDIPGNRGMLGVGYAGYFPLGDVIKLAELIDRAATDRGFYAQLQLHCDERKHLFAPALERAAVRQLVHNCLLQA